MEILMAKPDAFDVVEAINVHMTDAEGRLNRVDPVRARRQWEALRTEFERSGARVHVIEAAPGLPDFCFAANQSFPVPGTRQVVMSRMKSDLRAREVPYFERWYREHGFTIVPTPFEHEGWVFEGTGDGIRDDALGLVWAGHGFRSELAAWRWMERHFGLKIEPLKIVSPYFYHLDTCLAVLVPGRVVAYVPEAFEAEACARIEATYEVALKVPLQEAREKFSGNCFSVDGRRVILQAGAREFCGELRRVGLEPVEVETGEFLKSGGSVFCLKMVVG